MFLSICIACLYQMVAESANKPAQLDEAQLEAQQASVQEIQNLRTSLNQAQTRTTELEAQVDNLQKVPSLLVYFLVFSLPTIHLFKTFVSLFSIYFTINSCPKILYFLTLSWQQSLISGQDRHNYFQIDYKLFTGVKGFYFKCWLMTNIVYDCINLIWLSVLTLLC